MTLILTSWHISLVPCQLLHDPVVVLMSGLSSPQGHLLLVLCKGRVKHMTLHGWFNDKCLSYNDILSWMVCQYVLDTMTYCHGWYDNMALNLWLIVMNLMSIFNWYYVRTTSCYNHCNAIANWHWPNEIHMKVF